MAIRFLTRDLALRLHRQQIDLYGGAPGIRDERYLLSALGQPQSSFDGTYLHTGLCHMGAAYLYHIVLNHPFIDGNKRTGVAAGLTFLGLNGLRVMEDDHTESLYELTLAVIEGKMSKAQVAAQFQSWWL